MTKKLYWIWLTRSLNFSSSAISKVLERFNPEQAYLSNEDELLMSGIEESIAKKLSSKNLNIEQKILETCQKKEISIVTSEEDDFPKQLFRLSDMPHVIYVRGSLDCIKGKKVAAVAGTRRMSRHGEELTKELVVSMIYDGYAIVSGVAYGIDSVAARTSIERDIPTVAVLGVDIDKYSPAKNRTLIDKISRTGAVISEYPPYTDARFFPARNRIIAGLSDRVCIVEAPSGSGALITAKFALKLGIPTYAALADRPSFNGCYELIELGAHPLEMQTQPENEIIVTHTEEKKPKKKESTVLPDDELTGAKGYLYEKLKSGPKDDNELMDGKYSVVEVLCALTELELDGYIKSVLGGKYELRKRR